MLHYVNLNSYGLVINKILDSKIQLLNFLDTENNGFVLYFFKLFLLRNFKWYTLLIQILFDILFLVLSLFTFLFF